MHEVKGKILNGQQNQIFLREGQAMKEEKPKKKGLLAIIRESMIKTGGCCGPGEDCCGAARETGGMEGGDKDAKETEQDVSK
jgi:hypothetical protein